MLFSPNNAKSLLFSILQRQKTVKDLENIFFIIIIIIWRDRLSKWRRWKTLFLNSRLMCEYVKKKKKKLKQLCLLCRTIQAEICTTQKAKKVRQFLWKQYKLYCNTLHWTLTVAISSWDLMFYTRESNACLQKKKKNECPLHGIRTYIGWTSK